MHSGIFLFSFFGAIQILLCLASILQAIFICYLILYIFKDQSEMEVPKMSLFFTPGEKES